MIDVGTTLGGRYKLNARVGVGGMATVYDGEDLLLGRRVAVKIPLPSFAADPAFVTRFENEARAAAGLTHPNLVGVYDVGEADGTRFIVMEFVEGETLKDLIRRDGPLAPEDLVQVGTQIGDALDTAHRRGLVHRDVKPHNILLTPEGRVKLTDFGIALALGADSATRTGTLLGSVQYLAPEVARGESATPLADVYALGVVLYEMATAQLPYAGDTPLAIALQHVEAEARRPRELNPDLPPALEAIILRAMAKPPTERFATAADLADALRAFARGAPIPEAPAVEPGTSPGLAPAGPLPLGVTAENAAPAPDQAPNPPSDEGTTRVWTWGQPAGPSPWATAAGTARPATAVTPYPTSITPAWDAAPGPVYPSARWPLLLLGLVSLLCVLGLVPVGMLAYRQMRLPPAPPAVSPSGVLGPALDSGALAAVRAVPEWWAATARALVPIPRPGESSVVVGARGGERDGAWRGMVDHATALAGAGLRAAGETIIARLSRATAAADCEPVPRPTPGLVIGQACAAPEVVRGR